MRLISFVFLAALAACGGAVAESPLTVHLGLTHDQTEQTLKEHQFCLETSSATIKQQQQKQTYPRCKRAAAETGDAWVVASYSGDKLIELRRFERYADDNDAMTRWNELVTARMKLSQPSDQALQQLKDHGQLEAGTRTVKAFNGEGGTIVGVYLLTASPPDNANILEKVTYVQPQ